jgi:catechol 2,3-dioxygenase-like lactoylglutathione lyase family enzyme
MDLDHAVLWVDSAKRSLEFYVDVLGLEPVRAEDYAEGKARFPSVRINEATIFDLMERSELLSLVQNFTGGGDGLGGAPINHLCLSMSVSEYDAVSERLIAHGVKLKPGGENVFGARGQAVRSIYFNDPDQNVIEIRYYDEAR